jgi:hypothetical protein
VWRGEVCPKSAGPDAVHLDQALHIALGGARDPAPVREMKRAAGRNSRSIHEPSNWLPRLLTVPSTPKKSEANYRDTQRQFVKRRYHKAQNHRALHVAGD